MLMVSTIKSRFNTLLRKHDLRDMVASQAKVRDIGFTMPLTHFGACSSLSKEDPMLSWLTPQEWRRFWRINLVLVLVWLGLLALLIWFGQPVLVFPS